jgi:hypothetical protein
VKMIDPVSIIFFVLAFRALKDDRQATFVAELGALIYLQPKVSGSATLVVCVRFVHSSANEPTCVFFCTCERDCRAAVAWPDVNGMYVSAYPQSGRGCADCV